MEKQEKYLETDDQTRVIPSESALEEYFKSELLQNEVKTALNLVKKSKSDQGEVTDQIIGKLTAGG